MSRIIKASFAFLIGCSIFAFVAISLILFTKIPLAV